MSKVGDYAFCVVSTDSDGKPHLHISHYVFNNIDDANEFKAEMESDTADKFIVIQVKKMNRRPKL